MMVIVCLMNTTRNNRYRNIVLLCWHKQFSKIQTVDVLFTKIYSATFALLSTEYEIYVHTCLKKKSCSRNIPLPRVTILHWESSNIPFFWGVNHNKISQILIQKSKGLNLKLKGAFQLVINKILLYNKGQ